MNIVELKINFNFISAFCLQIQYLSVYLHTFKKGRLAQLVQSTSFTPRGSGVRTPHRPQKTSTEMLEFFLCLVFTGVTDIPQTLLHKYNLEQKKQERYFLQPDGRNAKLSGLPITSLIQTFSEKDCFLFLPLP